MQRSFRLLRPFLLALLFAALPELSRHAAHAQDVTLLRDGGFEGTYSNRGRADLNLPEAWSIWIADTPHTEAWMNLPPVVFPHNGPDPAPHGGARALNLNKGYATFTAAVYQQVSVENGANLTASAFAFLRTCDIPDGADRCESSGDSNAYTRIGIDPNGGTNPFDADVVWSSNAAPHEAWEQMTVGATATGTTVTLFLYSTQQWPAEINAVYWDDARLSVGGTGGVAAAAPGAPTPMPTNAASVSSAQGEQDDGSIVHIVEAGETLDSIAIAYGKTREELLAINDITNPRIIHIGQAINIQLPPTPKVTEALTAETTGEASDVTPPPAVRDAAPAPVISSASGNVLSSIDPTNSTVTICVTFFEDANGNRIQEQGEDALTGGQVLLTLDGTPAGQHTSNTDPYCFEDLAAGNYAVMGVAPDGYGLTTPDELRVRGSAGTRVSVAFGAAEGVATVEPPPPDAGGIVNTAVGSETDTRSTDNPLGDNIGLVVFGAAGVVLVAGIGVTLLLRRR